MIDEEEQYKAIYKTKEDIFNDIYFSDKEEKYRCMDIVNFVEKNAADFLRQEKVVTIPYIGTFYLEPINLAIKKNREEFKEANKNLSTSEYKEFVKSKSKEYYLEIEKKEREKKYREKYIKQFSTEYFRLYFNKSFKYAEIWLKSRQFKYIEPNYELDEFYINET